VNPLMLNLSAYPAVIDFITMVHYFSMYNDVHYKVSMMDLPDPKKEGRYISYEPARRIKIEDVKPAEETNVNIVVDSRVETTPTSKYYMFFYILYWIVSWLFIKIFYNHWNKPRKTGSFRASGHSSRR
jgi:uncharacterized protein YndB with AHSA1/START domain